MRIVRYYPRAMIGDGGMTGAVKRWSQGLVNAGAEAVIAFDKPVGKPERTDHLNSNGVEWVRVKHIGKTGMRVPVGLDKVFDGADLVVLHSGWVPHGIRAAGVARKMNIPYLLEPRGAYDPHIVRRRRMRKQAWWSAWERDLVMNSRAIHVFFEPERPHLRALGYPGPLVVASNGVDPPPDSGWDGGSDGYILWLGRFDPEHKGLDLLLQALRILPEEGRRELRLQGPDWRGRKASVVKLVDSLGLQKWVTVGEAVYGAEKRRLLCSAAGFVYPSRWDACPNSVLEAVASGVPTLTGPYPLGAFLASHGGAFVAEARAESLAKGLRQLQSEEAPEVAAKGARIVAEQLSWDQVARTWLSQVETLL
jgi:glycosyltransferase involved in cell wall biosynthesis